MYWLMFFLEDSTFGFLPALKVILASWKDTPGWLEAACRVKEKRPSEKANIRNLMLNQIYQNVSKKIQQSWTWTEDTWDTVDIFASTYVTECHILVAYVLNMEEIKRKFAQIINIISRSSQFVRLSANDQNQGEVTFFFQC